ncbi:acyl-CoA carboxylase subunit beta [Serinicoccus kebangsaanensis]|uniref:acyl-CoA carboxylase subunit beta n=1 Tax=Serinicoccus kebangsaanensis TaxID=2602069 RepID=UPI00124F55BD|nr:acyl-CoA carboxylase subunit beta [Serinicoccus kebangsaanensis]
MTDTLTSDGQDDDGPDLRTSAGRLDDYRARREQSVHAGSAKAVDKQHAKGKLTARERIDALLDEGSFTELDAFARHRCTGYGQEQHRPYGDGVVTGYGTVEGRPVAVFAHDYTVLGGTLGEAYGEKIVKVLDLAMKIGCPVVGMSDSGGTRLQEGVAALGVTAEIFRRNVHASGVIPQISMVMGPCPGGAAYSPAITDFVVMVDQTSHLFLTGPDVVKTVTGEDITLEDLAGARTHSTTSGVSHYLASDEDDAVEYVKELLGYLPQNNLEDPPVYDEEPDTEIGEADEALGSLVPDPSGAPYDITDAIRAVVDDGDFLQVAELFAPNLVVGFGRVEGRSVGVVANQPLHLAGTLDIDASEKAARFVRTCDAFNIPILTFVDVPGFLPGTDQEHGGIVRRGAKLLYAYAEATVPLVTVVTRKAIGGAYDVMGSKHLGADVNLAWPTAQIAVTGSQGAASVLHRRELAQVKADGGDVEAERARLVQEYQDTVATPYLAAERGYLDAVIEPAQTRVEVARALRHLRTKRSNRAPRKHGNIPL